MRLDDDQGIDRDPKDAPTAEDDESELIALTEQLQRFVIQQSNEITIQQVFDRYMSAQAVPETFDAFRHALTTFADDVDLADSLLLALLRSRAESDYWAALKSRCTPDLRRFLKALLSLYGDALQGAYDYRDNRPNGWKTATREVYEEIVSGEWRVNFVVTTYAGERLYLEESPTSLLWLAEAIVDTLNALPSEGGAGKTIERERLESFQLACSHLIEIAPPDANNVPLDASVSADDPE